jgi:hypothetical protein
MAVHMNGVDARAWVRGEKPWEQFLIYCDRLGSQQGTALWAAYLTDERLFEEYRKAWAARKDGKDDHRPSLVGFDRAAEGLMAVQAEIALLHRVTARNLAYPLPKGPLFPGERFENEDEEAEINTLHAEVAAGFERGRRAALGEEVNHG